MKKSKGINTSNYKNYKLFTEVELSAPASEVWDLVGGFYPIHHWHPDISLSEVPEDQGNERDIRRKLTFPGQDPTWEELVSMDNANMCYRYKWYQGTWGEMVQKYHAEIMVYELKPGETCVMRWSSTFFFSEDGLTAFYNHGYDNLIKKFGGRYRAHRLETTFPNA